MNSKSSIATRMTTVESNMESMGNTLNDILLSLKAIQRPSTSPPVNGETQGRESSANAVSPQGDIADAS